MRHGLLVWIAMLVATAAHADVFPVPYTGQLSQGGVPVTGKHYFSFAIYATAVGGSPIYAQAESLQVTAGVYSTFLNTPDTAWGDARWVGVAIDGGAELVPRVAVGVVPYAIIAGQAMEAKHALKADTANVAIGPPGSGLAQAIATGFFNMPAAGTIVVDSVTINCPAPGRVLVTATGYFNVAGLPSQAGGVILSLGAPSGTWPVVGLGTELVPYSCTQSFEATLPGPMKIQLFAQNIYAGNPVTLAPKTMNALYVPNGY
ncbi:MAG: hypothetical protein ACHQ52_07880 [Candidatus Eisenbacteria bacterium]